MVLGSRTDVSVREVESVGYKGALCDCTGSNAGNGFCLRIGLHNYACKLRFDEGAYVGIGEGETVVGIYR